MNDLIERVEKASGLQDDGGYALDADIARAVGWTYQLREATHTWQWHHPTNEHHVQAAPPRFSTSLDAAMTLVPEGMAWSVSTFISRGPRAEVYDINAVGGDSDAATPALALTAAALRARLGKVKQ